MFFIFAISIRYEDNGFVHSAFTMFPITCPNYIFSRSSVAGFFFRSIGLVVLPIIPVIIVSYYGSQVRIGFNYLKNVVVSSNILPSP